jgi:ribonuclease J
MISVKTDSHHLVIDCGILFPYDNCFGIDYLVIDFDKIDPPDCLIVTHGHEDHIGAIPLLVEKFPGLDIIASPFSRALIQRKFDFFPRKLEANFLDFAPSKCYQFGDIQLDYIGVNHSIPETFGIHLTYQKNSIFYISDYKVDDHPLYEEPFDFKKLLELSKNCQNRYLMADSTNTLSRTQKTPSESTLVEQFQKILSRGQKRTFITTFSSNVYRLKLIFEAAKKLNKKIVLYGASAKSYTEIADQCGLLQKDSYPLVDSKSITGEEENLVIIVSGCQADFKSAMRRIAYGDDGLFYPGPDDLFVFSSKAIPGNEKLIGLMINQLVAKHADVITEIDEHVHVSGHAGLEDLARVIKEYAPHHFIPIHGESYFLKRSFDHIKVTYPQIFPHLMENYQSFSIPENQISESESHFPICIHGNAHKLEKNQISERRKIAQNGLVIVAISSGHRRNQELNYSFFGVPFSPFGGKEQLEKKLANLISKIDRRNNEYLQEQSRIAIRRYLNSVLGYKPIVNIMLV